MNIKHAPGYLFSMLVLTAVLGMFACAVNANADDKGIIQGTVLTGDVAIEGATVKLYSSRHNNGDRALERALTGPDGSFSLAYKIPKRTGRILYLTSSGGRLSNTQQPVPPQYSLAVVIGAPSPAATVVMNDRTTVASAFAMAQFIRNRRISGKNPGLSLAARMVENLVDIETGEPGATISNGDNDPTSQFSALKTLNEMANLVASCATDAAACDAMMQLALPLRGKAPKDTFRAVANMARTPWRDPVPLFNLVQSDDYQPGLGVRPPSAWVLSLKFKGDPVQLAGPGNMAFDSDGQMWIVNNLVTDETYVLPDCGSQLLFRMDPATGKVETFSGGGVVGAGYGVGIAPKSGDIWVGNYGFKGSTCLGNLTNNSVSQFSPDGIALSPDATEFDIFGNPQNGGWTNGGIGWPQGTVSNRRGDIWIASCNGETTGQGQADVTVYRKGNPDEYFVIMDENLVKPFDVAFDRHGRGWVSGTLSDNIFAFNRKGKRLAMFDLGQDARPMGVASDSRGNVWVSLSGQIELPCPDAPAKLLSGVTGIAMVNHKGVQLNTREQTLAAGSNQAPGGMTITWGIAVDGADVVWVANFERGGVSSFCGARKKFCPKGFQTGDALSPDATGYHSDLLDRNTGVEIDTSGNVWLTNNWKDLPLQTDPAGDSMVVFIGLATPVRAPLKGTPRRP